MRPAAYLLLLVAVATACASQEAPGEAAGVASVTRTDSASAPAEPAGFDWRGHLGRVEPDRDRGPCLVADRGMAHAGDTLWIVSDAMEGQRVGRGVTGAPGACGALHGDVEEVFPVTFLSSSREAGPAGIAILGFEDRVEVREGRAVADLDQDGSPESFGFCTSMEGVHMTVWTGRVAEGIRRWHAYQPLFYDVEPSCTEAELSEP